MKKLPLLLLLLIFLQSCVNMMEPSQLAFEDPTVGGQNYFTHCKAPPIELTESFRRNCASCHGQEGQGGFSKTLTATTLSYESFLKVTRGETRISTEMPAFSESSISTDDILKNYIALHHDRYLADCSSRGQVDPPPPPGGTSGTTGGGVGDPLPGEDPKFSAFKRAIYQSNSCLSCHGPNTAIDFTALRTSDDWLNSPFVTAGKPNLSTIYSFLRGVEQQVPGRTYRVMPPREEGPSVVEEDFDAMENFTSTASVGAFSLVQDIGKSLRLTFSSPLSARAIEHVVPVGANKTYRLTFGLKNLTNTTLSLKVLEEKKTAVLGTLVLPHSPEWSSYSTEFSTNGFVIQNGKSWANFRIEVGAGAAGRNVTVDNIRLVEVTE
jgi:mono/diheme cytochrome c family protein